MSKAVEGESVTGEAQGADTAAALLVWHSELSGALRTLHDQGHFRVNWFSNILLHSGSLLWLPFMLLTRNGWYFLFPLLAGMGIALYIHGRWLLKFVKKRVEESGQVDALLARDPELLANYGIGADNTPLSPRLAEIADQARSHARIPLLLWLNTLLWIVAAGAVVLYGFDQQLFRQPMQRAIVLVGVGLIGITSSLLLLIGESARQHLLLLLSKGVAGSLGLPLHEVFAPRLAPVERIARRLGVTKDSGLIAVMILAALLFLGGVLLPLIWGYMWTSYSASWVIPLVLIVLNCAGGILSIIEGERYRRDVRTQIESSDLPLRIAMGQVQPPRRFVLTLAKERFELERAAQAAAERLPQEIGLHSRYMGKVFVSTYITVAAMAMALLGSIAYGYEPDLTTIFGLVFASLPLLLFPVFAMAYKRAINSEELVRLLRLQQVS